MRKSFLIEIENYISIFLSESQPLCFPLLGLWMHLPYQHHSTAVSHEQILRGRILVLWLARHEFLRAISRWPHRSNGLYFPQSHQVHLPQIWSVGQHTKTRQSLHSSSQHRQREDLHLHLVLVHDPSNGTDDLGHL